MERVERPPLQSEESMGYEKFIEVIKYLVDACWGEHWGTFTQEEPSMNDPKSITLPVISCELQSLVPGLVGKTTKEIRPRVRQVVRKEKDSAESSLVTVVAQVLDGVMVFKVFEESNYMVEKRVKEFRAFMATYTGYFKKKGLKDLVFLEMKTTATPFYDSCKVRELHYRIAFEEITEIPGDVLKHIEVVERNLHKLNQEL